MTASTGGSRAVSSWSSGTRYGTRAARTLCLARVRRFAIVGSGSRKPRATSSDVNPPISRSVRAICASGARAGWQHVNMSRSRSSCIGDPSWHGAVLRPSGSRATTSPSNSRSRFLRRKRSIAWFRAVVVIQPPGFGGSPSAGQRRRATANASCNGVLGKVDIAEDADQRGHGAPELLPEDAADLGRIDRRRRADLEVRPALSRRHRAPRRYRRTAGPRSGGLPPSVTLAGPRQCGVEVCCLD